MYTVLVLVCLSSPCSSANDLPPYNQTVEEFRSLEECRKFVQLAMPLITPIAPDRAISLVCVPKNPL
jgi:hypothetical protein